MTKSKVIALVECLERRTEDLRTRIGISKRGEMIFHAPLSMWSSKDVAVEADGKGGASLIVVEGNYPVDYLVHSERRFTSEHEACEVAEEMLEDTSSNST